MKKIYGAISSYSGDGQWTMLFKCPYCYDNQSFQGAFIPVAVTLGYVFAKHKCTVCEATSLISLYLSSRRGRWLKDYYREDN